MRLFLPLLICFGFANVFAENWEGALVDSQCYASEEANLNPLQGSRYVIHDVDQEIRVCRPRPHKTNSFAIVQQDGTTIQLDPAGNMKAKEVVDQAGKKRVLWVDVTGVRIKDNVEVDSISLAK